VTAGGQLPGWPNRAVLAPPSRRSALCNGRPPMRAVQRLSALRPVLAEQLRPLTEQPARTERVHVTIQLHPSRLSQLMRGHRVTCSALRCSSPSPHGTGVSRTPEMSGSSAKSSCRAITYCRVIALVHRRAYEGSTYLLQVPNVRRGACRGGRQPSRCLLDGSAQTVGICSRRARAFLSKGRHCEFGFERAGRRT
jgi:hypothetical protein